MTYSLVGGPCFVQVACPDYLEPKEKESASTHNKASSGSMDSKTCELAHVHNCIHVVQAGMLSTNPTLGEFLDIIQDSMDESSAPAQDKEVIHMYRHNTYRCMCMHVCITIKHPQT